MSRESCQGLTFVKACFFVIISISEESEKNSGFTTVFSSPPTARAPMAFNKFSHPQPIINSKYFHALR